MHLPTCYVLLSANIRRNDFSWSVGKVKLSYRQIKNMIIFRFPRTPVRGSYRERKLVHNFHQIFRIVLEWIYICIIINLIYIDVFSSWQKIFKLEKLIFYQKWGFSCYFLLSFCYRIFIIFKISYKLYTYSSIYRYLIFVLLW